MYNYVLNKTEIPELKGECELIFLNYIFQIYLTFKSFVDVTIYGTNMNDYLKSGVQLNFILLF